jgi:hypothetical protein
MDYLREAADALEDPRQKACEVRPRNLGACGFCRRREHTAARGWSGSTSNMASSSSSWCPTCARRHWRDQKVFGDVSGWLALDEPKEGGRNGVHVQIGWDGTNNPNQQKIHLDSVKTRDVSARRQQTLCLSMRITWGWVDPFRGKTLAGFSSVAIYM